jgi:hypothetical protein
LKSFQLPSPGRLPGGWFAALSVERRRGETSEPATRLVFDRAINTDRHEDDWRTGEGEPGVRNRITVGGREFDFDSSYANLDVHTMLAADGKLFVVTLDGHLWCFGSGESRGGRYPLPAEPLDSPQDEWTAAWPNF